MYKICACCRTSKKIDAFPQKKNQTHIHSWCKLCTAAKQREYVRTHPGYLRRVNLKAKYGITPEQYEIMVQGQNGKCAICLKNAPTGKNLAIDHDHKCCLGGKKSICGSCIRALLCQHCNRLLGAAFDSVEILQAAISYLEKHKGKRKWPQMMPSQEAPAA